MKILALDTSTQACSVALSIDGEYRSRHEIAPREHSNLILPMIDELISEAGISLVQLDAIAYGRGPGSFVGLRIAAGVTQALAFASELPVVAVSSLAALAQGHSSHKTLVAFDARMGEVYWGVYTRETSSIVEPQISEQVCPPNQVKLPCINQLAEWVGVGTGWLSYPEQLKTQIPGVIVDSEHLYPHANNIALLGTSAYQQGLIITAQDVQPVYVRDQVVTVSKKS